MKYIIIVVSIVVSVVTGLYMTGMYNDYVPSIKETDQDVAPAIVAGAAIAGALGQPEIAIPLSLSHAAIDVTDSYLPDKI